jgi:hypothetical protein
MLFPTQATAVCVPPGARLLVRDISEHLQRSFGVTKTEEVTFIEQSVEAFTHRDAIRFANGREVLLQDLQSAQRVEVLSLCGAEEEKKVQKTEWESHFLAVSAPD